MKSTCCVAYFAAIAKMPAPTKPFSLLTVLYRRSIKDSHLFTGKISLSSLLILKNASIYRPVSYTHLDVYKRQASCRTAVQDGMVVQNTTSPEVMENRRAITEFLLLNHPLDCPVCDQAGECHLQDLSLIHI